MRWRRGEAGIEALLADGDLERVAGSEAEGAAWVAEARTTLDSARLLARRDTRNATTLAYDAARHACAGLLAHQGLRATRAGGHVTIERAVVAQFGPGFATFGVMRRRRHELQYPRHPGEPVEHDDAVEAIDAAAAIVDAVERLLPKVGLF